MRLHSSGQVTGEPLHDVEQGGEVGLELEKSLPQSCEAEVVESRRSWLNGRRRGATLGVRAAGFAEPCAVVSREAFRMAPRLLLWETRSIESRPINKGWALSYIYLRQGDDALLQDTEMEGVDMYNDCNPDIP